MALIQCPECNRDVSDKALACPHCGYPLSTSLQHVSAEEMKEPSTDLPIPKPSLAPESTVDIGNASSHAPISSIPNARSGETARFVGIKGWLSVYLNVVRLYAITTGIRTFTWIFVPGAQSGPFDLISCIVLVYLAIEIPRHKWRAILVARSYHGVAVGLNGIFLVATHPSYDWIIYVGFVVFHFSWFLYLFRSRRVEATFSVEGLDPQAEKVFCEDDRVVIRVKGTWLPGTVALNNEDGVVLLDSGDRIQMNTIDNCDIEKF